LIINYKAIVLFENSTFMISSISQIMLSSMNYSFDTQITFIHNQDMRSYDTKFLNIMKLLMAFFVMVVHFSPFKTIDPLLHFISIHGFTRIAVPFFILSSGYLISENGKIGEKRLSKTLKKLAKLYVFWTLLYSPLILAQVVYSPDSTPWWINLTRNVFFEGSFIHLWYLIATIIGLLIVTRLMAWMNMKLVVLVVLLLFILGVLGDSYYGWSITVPVLSSFKAVLFQFIRTTRNGIFFAPIFLIGGILIKQFQPHFKKTTLLITLVTFIILSLVEILLLRNAGWARDYNMTFSILPLSITAFLLALHIHVSFDTQRYKEIAATLFYIHIGVYVFIQFILTSGDVTQFRNYGFLAFVLTLILSMLLTLLIHRFKHIPWIKEYFM
jgi:serine/alanine racemase